MVILPLDIFEEIYTLLELPFHAELNGLCSNSVYHSTHKL